MANIFEKNKIYLGDCLDIMPTFPDGVFDMILCDLPYGTTACKWDVIIPFDKLWEQYERLIKPNGAIVLTASQPFTTLLINSKFDLFKYCWYWIKTKPNGFQHAKNRPMMKVEEVCVFSKAPMGHTSQLKEKRMCYNPQGVISAGTKKIQSYTHGSMMGARDNQIGNEYEAFTNFPNNVLEYINITNFTRDRTGHPTEKPVSLMEYLIRTYTNEGELILDNCAGSGTTGIACYNTNRNYVMIEKEKQYFDLFLKREEKNILIKKENEAQTSLWNTANGI